MEFLSVILVYALVTASVVLGRSFGFRNSGRLSPHAFLGKLLLRALSIVVPAGISAFLGYTTGYASEETARLAFLIFALCAAGYAIMAIVSYELHRRKPPRIPRI